MQNYKIKFKIVYAHEKLYIFVFYMKLRLIKLYEFTF